MRHFQITGTFEGAIELYYNELGLLERYDVSGATLTEAQQRWSLENIPITSLPNMMDVMKKTNGAVLTEVKVEVTFELFWNKYDDKQCSSKKKAMIVWKKMSYAQQVKAYDYLNKYFMFMAPGTRKKYAETYLHAELWNN